MIKRKTKRKLKGNQMAHVREDLKEGLKARFTSIVKRKEKRNAKEIEM